MGTYRRIEVIDAAESTYFIDGKRALTAYDGNLFQCIDQAELGKALSEELFGKYKETANRQLGVNEAKEATQNAVSEEKSEEKRNRFGIPAWLENKALRAYEGWLCIHSGYVSAEGKWTCMEQRQTTRH